MINLKLAHSLGLNHPGDTTTIAGQGIFVIAIDRDHDNYGRLERILKRFDEDRPEEVVEAYKEAVHAEKYRFIGQLVH